MAQILNNQVMQKAKVLSSTMMLVCMFLIVIFKESEEQYNGVFTM